MSPFDDAVAVDPATFDPNDTATARRHRSAGEQLDGILRDLDRTTAEWVAAGYPFEGPVFDAREAVFARLKEWNRARETPRTRPPL